MIKVTFIITCTYNAVKLEKINEQYMQYLVLFFGFFFWKIICKSRLHKRKFMNLIFKKKLILNMLHVPCYTNIKIIIHWYLYDSRDFQIIH